MSGEQRQELGDGSYFITDMITNLSDPSADSPLLKMDLSIHQTFQSVVVSRDEAGNPRAYLQELEVSHIRVPTLELPGNPSRDHYSSAFHKWLRSVHLDYPLDDDFLWEFSFQMVDAVFEILGYLPLHQKVALCVSADLHCVPTLIGKDDDEEDYDPVVELLDEEEDPMEDEEYDPTEDEEEEYEPMEDEEEEYDPVEDVDEEYEPMEDEEEDNGDESLMIKPAAWVQALSDSCAVVAADEHRKLGDCLICLDPLFSLVVSDKEEDGNNKCLFGSPCGHYFHGHCMSEWLTRSVSCPLCRFNMKSLIEQ